MRCAAEAYAFQAFDVALIVTIIVGASIGGFGTLFENMSEETAVVFLKVCSIPSLVVFQHMSGDQR